jgi:hypothetical protein
LSPGRSRLVCSTLELHPQFLDKVGAEGEVLEVFSCDSVYTCCPGSFIGEYCTQGMLNPVLPTDEMIQVPESMLRVMFRLPSEAMLSQTDSVHTSPGLSSDRLLRPSTGGLPDGLAHCQTLYVSFTRSQYYAPSATLGPLQPQVVQSPRDGSQRFPRSHDCPLHSGLGRSWTPVGCALHPRCGPYASTPLARTVRPSGLFAWSVRKPCYTTAHAILIISQRGSHLGRIERSFLA